MPRPVPYKHVKTKIIFARIQTTGIVWPQCRVKFVSCKWKNRLHEAKMKILYPINTVQNLILFYIFMKFSAHIVCRETLCNDGNKPNQWYCISEHLNISLFVTNPPKNLRSYCGMLFLGCWRHRASSKCYATLCAVPICSSQLMSQWSECAHCCLLKCFWHKCCRYRCKW